MEKGSMIAEPEERRQRDREQAASHQERDPAEQGKNGNKDMPWKNEEGDDTLRQSER